MVAEVALALVLLTGAGLMIRTVLQLTQVDTGFRADHLLTLQLSFRGQQWTDVRRVAFMDDVFTRVRALPGVVNAAASNSLPIDGSQWTSVFVVEGRPAPERRELIPSAAMTPVSAGYFETMGTRLVSGRFFTDGDGAQTSRVVVINETLARRIWPGEKPLGKRLKQGFPETPGTWREVVGVVADVKHDGLSEQTPMQVYMPFPQVPSSDLALVMRTAPILSLRAPVEAVVHALDRDLPVYSVRTMERVLEASIARERMAVLVLMVFAIVALTLASVGLYGVVAHGVTERTHEIGVRIALGAERRHVLGLVVRQGLSMAALRTVLGVGGAIAVSRWIEGLLFGVTATDPTTIVSVVAMLSASRSSPVTCRRGERVSIRPRHCGRNRDGTFWGLTLIVLETDAQSSGDCADRSNVQNEERAAKPRRAAAQNEQENRQNEQRRSQNEQLNRPTKPPRS